MKVSIVIPVFNAQDTIGVAVDSALAQKFGKKDFEVIVINDGSTDATLEILEKYGKKITIISQKNKGAVTAANRGFKKAKGKYLIKLDADDWFDARILEVMAGVLDKKENIDFVYSDYYEKSSEGKTRTILTGNNIFNTGSVGIMFKAEKFKAEGFYRQDLKFSEYDLLLRTQKAWNGFHIQKALFCRNLHNDSLTGSKQWVREAMEELKRIHPQKLTEIKKIRKY